MYIFHDQNESQVPMNNNKNMSYSPQSTENMLLRLRYQPKNMSAVDFCFLFAFDPHETRIGFDLCTLHSFALIVFLFVYSGMVHALYHSVSHAVNKKPVRSNTTTKKRAAPYCFCFVSIAQAIVHIRSIGFVSLCLVFLVIRYSV